MSEEIQVEQRTDAWLAHKAGKISASKMKHALAFSKRDGKPLQARQDYMIELAYERLSGKSIGIPMSPPMQWGVDVEPAARSAYEAKYGVVLETPGFIVMDNGYIGCSPDGRHKPGGCEIKCPFNPTVHAMTWLNGMPEEHMPQLQCTMMVTDSPWWDFVSYDPRAPEAGRLYIQRIPRDDDYIKDMLYHCGTLNDEVNEMVGKLREMWGMI